MRSAAGRIAAGFASPDLRRVQVAWAASTLGHFAFLIGLVVIAFHAGGASAVGLLMLLRMVVAAVASPLTAPLADSRSRRAVMVVSDLVRAGMIVLLALAAGGHPSLAVVYLLAAAIALVGAPFRPAQAALLPALAATPEQLTATNAVASTIESAGVFLGPGIGGLILAAGTPRALFFVCAAAFVASAAMVRGVTEPARGPRPAPAGGETGALAAVTAGARTLLHQGNLAAVVGVYALQALAVGALGVFTAVLALKVLHMGNAGVGYLDSACGVGGILGGALAASTLTGGRRLAAAFSGGLLAWGVGIALVGVSTWSVATLCLLAGVGIGNTVVDVAAVTLMQRAAPEQVLGRVFGALEAIMLAAMGLGAVIAPALISLIGTRAAIVAVGLSLPIAVAVTHSRIRELDRVSPELAGRVALLAGTAIFQPMPAATLEQLARHLQPLAAAAGDVVIHQGEPGDLFYLVAEGRLAVDVDGAVGAPIETGGFFGEIALLRDSARTATVTALTHCALLTLERGEFLAAVTGHPQTAEQAGVVVSTRLGALRPAISI